MDRVSAEFPHDPDGLRSNVVTADRVRAARVEHSIEDSHADSRFNLLTREAART
jgi:plasmid stability protein